MRLLNVRLWLSKLQPFNNRVRQVGQHSTWVYVWVKACVKRRFSVKTLS